VAGAGRRCHQPSQCNQYGLRTADRGHSTARPVEFFCEGCAYDLAVSLSLPCRLHTSSLVPGCADAVSVTHSHLDSKPHRSTVANFKLRRYIGGLTRRMVRGTT
jgi:hypothetical protein